MLELPELPVFKKSEEKDSDAYESVDREDLIKRVRELEAENLSLREKIWKSNYGWTRMRVIGLIGTGAASLAASYFYESFILTLIGLGLTLWGFIFVYITHIRTVPEDIISSMPVSLMKALDKVIVGSGYRGRCNFLYPRFLKGLKQGYIFFSDGSANDTLPNDAELSKENLFYENPKGILLPAHSQGLVDLYENKLNVNFAYADLSYVSQSLSKLLVEDLRLVDEITITQSDGMVQTHIVGKTSAELCRNISTGTVTGKQLGCPLCSSIALVLSKAMGRAVTIKSTEATLEHIKTVYEFVGQPRGLRGLSSLYKK
jgi:hypothetical protein